MSDPEVYICHPSALEELKKIDCKWVFIDGDTVEAKYFSINSTPLLKPNEFHEALVHLRSTYTKWVDENLELLPQLEQILSPLTRNPFDEFYREAMWAVFIAKKITTISKTIVVVTSSIRVGRVLEQFSRENKITIHWIGKFSFYSSWAKYQVGALIYFIQEYLFLMWAMTLSKFIFDKSYLIKIQSAAVFIDVFLFSGDITKDGVYNEKYYPKLMDWFRNKNIIAAYIPILLQVSIRDTFSFLNNLKKSKVIFVPYEYFLKAQDLLEILLIVFRFGFKKKLRYPIIDGINMSPMISCSTLSAILNKINAIVVLLTPRRMASKKLNPLLILDWFENQTVDQALMFGFTKAFPRCKVAAIRPYALYSQNLLSYHITTREVRSGIVPKNHFVGGSSWLAHIASYDSLGKYELIPSFRNINLFKIKAKKSFGQCLTVALPYSNSESQYILIMVAKCIELILDLYDQVKIKVHPATHLHPLQKFFESKVDKSLLHFIGWEHKNSFGSLLPETKVIVSGGSSAVLEAAIFGIPVIFLPFPRGIDLCPYEHLDKFMFSTTYCIENFRKSLIDFSSRSNGSRNVYHVQGATILNSCYVDFSERNMKNFENYLIQALTLY